MFKAIYNGISCLIFKNPRVTKVKRREIVSYFKNSIEKKFIVINLDHYSSFEFFEERKVEEKDNNFSLYFIGINGRTDTEDKILLATFNNKKDVESAVKYLQNKYFSLGGALLKFIFWIVLFFVVFSGIFGKSNTSPYPTMEEVQALQGMTPNMTNSAMTTAGVPGVNQQKLLTPEQQKAYADQIQAALAQMKPNPNIPGAQQAPEATPAAPTPQPQQAAPAQEQQPNFTSAFSK
jgi:hypothetical protein